MDCKTLQLLAVLMFFKHSETAWRSAAHRANTYRKRRIPVLAKAKARPKIPLPIIALLRLKTDIPNEVVPGIWRSKDRQVSNNLERSRGMHLRYSLFCNVSEKSISCYGKNLNWFERGKTITESCHGYTLDCGPIDFAT